MNRYLSQKAFAKLVGVSPAAINKALRDGRIVRTERGIDPAHPTNMYYSEQSNRYRDPQKNGKKVIKRAKKKTEKNQQVENDQDLETEPEQEIMPAGVNVDAPSKYEAERKRIEAQTTKINIAIAERMGELVLREDVSKAFGKIYSVAINHFLPMGDRLAPLISGICGTSDQEIIIKVKDKIDTEITRALEGLKREALRFDAN